MLIESLRPLRIHLKLGSVELVPGQPIELSEDDGKILLTKVPDVVRRISSLTPRGCSQILDSSNENISGMPLDIIPAVSSAKHVYWETGNGRILGPAIPEFLAKSGGQFWIVTTFEGHHWWIDADRLRSKQDFETQRAVHEVELIQRF